MDMNNSKAKKFLLTFLKWGIIAVVVGLVGGTVGSLFHICVDYATEIRVENNWLITLLPIGGILIVGISKLLHAEGVMNTNKVLEAVRTENKIPFIMAPLIFVSTVITHLLGGSAGREGAALQLGGSLGFRIGKIFRLNKNDMHVVIMAGMSAVFTAMFGTPLTATVFAIEVISVGIMYYAALFPCITAAVTALAVAKWFKILPVAFQVVGFAQIDAMVVAKVAAVAVLCALVSILFCLAIKKCEHYFEKYMKNSFVRAAVGGVILVLLTLVFKTTDYNGAGMDIIENAMSGEARPEAFLLKILFTVITISAGFKGGEIVPTFFIGSTLGCVAGEILGLEPGVGAALGFVALFCGVVNCPIASMFLAIEVFGGQWTLMFGLVCAISYLLSGYSSLYKSQKFIYSKIEAKFIDNQINM